MKKYQVKILFAILLSLMVIFTSVNRLSAGTPVTPPAPANLLYPACIRQTDVDKWGFIDITGTFVIKPAYAYVSDFNSKGIAIAIDSKAYYETGKVYLIDRTGKTVAGPFTGSAPQNFENGYIVLKSNTGYVLMDETAKIVLQSTNTLYAYQDGMLRFSTVTGGKELYGYMDITGKIIIPAKYQYAGEFSNGLAVVTINDTSYAIIDKKGKLIKVSDHYINSGDLSQDFIPYSVKIGDYDYLYGYQTTAGKIVTPAKYSYIDGFKDGIAIVAESKDEEYNEKYGLIDKTGKYIIQPQYSGITYLGEGLYAVSNNFYSYDDQYTPKALFSGKGVQLTDFKFYTVNPFVNHMASVTDETTTFIIGTDGKPVAGMPKTSGIGTMTVMGDIIKAEIDGYLGYLKKDGTPIWKEADTVSLGSGISIGKQKYRNGFCTFAEYPAVSGLTDPKIQTAINTRLKSIFTDGLTDGKSTDDDGTPIYTETTDIWFSAWLNKNLLIIQEGGYYYPIGAAHGMPSMTYYYIDVKTGAFYSMNDLFKKNMLFLNRLTSLVGKQIELNLRTNAIMDNFYYFDEKPVVTASHGYIINKDCLTVYFEPYEIQSYAAGFQTFDIPWGQLSDLIDTNGAFWNSFDKTVVNSKINIIGDPIDTDIVTSIANTMKSYETTMIDAINLNDFTKVEASLLKGSTLYNSQKQLVPYLYSKGTKEKLISYDIYAIEYDYGKNEYKVFVNETVAVKYAGKDYVNYPYSWCYTAVYNSTAKTTSLSKIEKW